MRGLRTLLFTAGLACAFLLTMTRFAKESGSHAALAADPTNPGPPVTSRLATLNGQTAGEVLVGDRVVIRLFQPENGENPGDRASRVAQRLQGLLNQGFGARDISVGMVSGETVLMMGNQILVTADPYTARVDNTSPQTLGNEWAAALRDALSRSAGGEYPRGNGGPRAEGNGRENTTWPEWSNPSSKVVPIISLGTPGVQLGFAQVTGPSERVDRVRAVFELDADFQRVARVRAFIPSNSLTGFNRVQGVAVSGLLSYQVMSF